ncbi:MAG TPA: hypothetical protein VHK01_16680, partial [Lacipirellulaceae bacterium]|nr:hypothetical protein [Lacipirellulaceae bacterium]
EELDPEGVKQARSLMAFGALARARAASADASAASRPAAATATANNDAEASPEAGNEFPDPANYVEGEASKNNAPAQADGEREGSSVAAEKSSVAADARGSEDVASFKEVPAAKAASPAAVDAPATSQAATSTEDVEFNRLLVIGVPLAGAVLLMGIYWLILRAGAL